MVNLWNLKYRFFCLYQITNYYYCIITKWRFYIVTNSWIDLIQNHTKDCSFLYINNIYTYQSTSLLHSGLIIFIIILLLYSNFTVYIEVHSFNSYALSMYLWMGSQIINKRPYYYNLFCSPYSNTAYSLNNSRFFTKNILRRYIMLINV